MPNPSPTLLSNSAFSSLNLFPPTPTHVPARHSSHPKPTLHRSITPKKSPSIPTRNSSIVPSDTFYSPPSTPDLSYYTTDHSPRATVNQTSSAPITPTAISHSFISLDSPSHSPMSTLGTPFTASQEVEPVRRGRFVENFSEEDMKPQVLFGQSAQRTRRMRKPVTLDLSEKPFPSPTPSSDEDPLPVTPGLQDKLSSRSWSVNPAPGLTGLGVQGIKDFEDFKSTGFALSPITEGPTHDLSLTELCLNSETSLSLHIPSGPSSPVLFTSSLPSTASPPVPRRPCPRRLLSSSQSLNSFAAPFNLTELRQLQQAALDLQHEAKRSCAVPQEREKKIRRKIVPTLSCQDYIGTSSQASGSGSTQTYTLEVAEAPEMSLSSSASSVSSFGDSPVIVSQSATLATLPISQNMTSVRSTLPPPRESPLRRMYGNAMASMSMIDISPRQSSLPISPPHSESGKKAGHQRATSGPASQRSPSSSVISGHDDGSSDSGESFDQPLTPNSFNSGMAGRVGGNGFQFAPLPSAAKTKKAGGGIYGNKSAFMSQLDLGLKRVMDRKVDQKDEEKKSKKGFGRFLGMKA